MYNVLWNPSWQWNCLVKKIIQKNCISQSCLLCDQFFSGIVAQSLPYSLLYFVVPITQTWREELKRFTEAAGIKSKNPYTNTTSYQVPPSRQGSRQGERPPPSRGRELPPPSRNGEKPPSRNGEMPPSRNGEKPPSRQGESRQGERASMSRQGLPMQHIAPESDSDLTVSDVFSFEILSKNHKMWCKLYALPERCSRKKVIEKSEWNCDIQCKPPKTPIW